MCPHDSPFATAIGSLGATPRDCIARLAMRAAPPGAAQRRLLPQCCALAAPGGLCPPTAQRCLTATTPGSPHHTNVFSSPTVSLGSGRWRPAAVPRLRQRSGRLTLSPGGGAPCPRFLLPQHIMVDLGTGNNNKINWAMNDKQEFIDIVETVYRGARKGRGLVVSPKDYSTKYRY